MDKNILIRNAEVGDIEKIKSILFSSLKEYGISIPDNYSVSDIESLGADSNCCEIFILVRGSAVIGFVILRPITDECIELKRLYVAFSERGRGLGEYLLKYATAFAEEKNYKSIRLETVSKFKEAVCLYKKHDFMELKGVEKAAGHDLAFEKRIATC